jgi:hypothetical protein
MKTDVKTTFANVKYSEGAKEEVQEIVESLKTPEKNIKSLRKNSKRSFISWSWNR